MPASPSSKAPTSPRVAALVLNYNGRDITLQSLASLERMDYDAVDLVMIDNGSTDDSAVAVATAHPDVIQVRVPENHGISWGMNYGLRWVLEREYDYVLILNNDIEVDAAMLREMVTVAEARPDVGAVGPKAYYYGDRERLWSTGGFLRFRHAITRERGDGEIDRGQYDADGEVDYVNGCAMLVRRRALEETGLWDPTYFLGVEDADWCQRMKRLGWRCWYAHRARLWHMISYSTGVYKPGRTFQTGRSTAIFVRKFARPLDWLSFLGWTALALPAAFVRELPKGNQGAAIAKAKGLADGLRARIRSTVEAGAAFDGRFETEAGR